MINLIRLLRFSLLSICCTFIYLNFSSYSYADTSFETTDWIFPNTIDTATFYTNPLNVLERDGNITTVSSGSGRLRVANFDPVFLPNDVEITKIEIRFHLAGVRTVYRFGDVDSVFGQCFDHESFPQKFNKNFIVNSKTILDDYIVNYTNQDCDNINEEYIKNGNYFVEMLRFSGIAEYKVDDISVRFTYSTHSTKHPLILIPGIAGSELKNVQFTSWLDDDGHGGLFSNIYQADEIVWLNTTEALKPGNDDYFDVLRMNPDGQTGKASLVPSVNFVPEAYGEFVDYFTSNGYTLDQDLFLFPYDWRMDIAHTKPLLDSKIDEIKQQTGAEKVDIVAHSMGGLVARNYIKDVGMAQNVKKLITLGTPHLGSPNSLKAIMYGDCLTREEFEDLPYCAGVSDSEVKDVLQNMISAYELIPSMSYFQFYFGDGIVFPYPYADFRDIDSNSNTYGTLDYSEIKLLLKNLKYNTQLFSPSEYFHDLDDNLANTYDVDVRLITGSGIATLGQIIEGYKIDSSGNKTPTREQIAINGDKTVPLYSASPFNSTLGISLLGEAPNLYFTLQKHEDLVKNGPALDLSLNILNDDENLPTGTSLSPYHLNGYILSIHSPVNLHVYDQNGNHTGPTGDDDIEVDIPGSTYDTLEDAKFIWLPENGIYNIEFESTGIGNFDFKIRKFENDINTHTILYKDVPLTVLTKANTIFNTSSAQPPVLNLDVDGNGSTDSFVENFSVMNEESSYDHTPPEILFEVDKDTIWPPNGKMINIAITGEIDDDNPYKTTILVKDEYSLVQPYIEMNDYGIEIDHTIQLQASRRADDIDGRTYTIKVFSTDLAGNSSLESVIVTVPHDQGR